MRRSFGWVLVAVLILAACGSDGDDTSSSTSSVPSSTVASTTTSTTSAAHNCVKKLQDGSSIDDCQEPGSSTTTPTTVPPTPTTVACPASGSTAPFASSPSADPANVLRTVRVTGQRCTDRVVFGFRPAQGPPQCTVKYASGPFSEDASGRPVTVAGTAFLVVRCSPARSYDVLSGKPTYTAPKDKHTAVAGTQHVVDLVAIGDFEAVMSWVIGLDAERPFSGASLDGGQLVVTVF